jgi:hypothetical protein
MAAAQNVLLYQNLPLQDKITAAYSVKSDFLQFLRAKGKLDLAKRLGGTGSESYPDSEDFELLGEFLGGQVVLESTEVGEAGPIYYNTGCPRVVVLGHRKVLDGNGHSSPHYELKQTFFEPIAKPSYTTTAPSDDKIMSMHALKSRLDLPGASSNDDMWATRMRKFKEGRRKLSHYKPLPLAKDTSVVGSVKELFKLVDEKNPQWSDYKKRIAVALLAIYKMKPAQCALTDHLKLLWIFLGDHFLRAHDGHCFFYEADLGAFTTFHGVLPYSHFMYMRQICLHLEGLCREFPSGIERSDECVLAAIEAVFNRSNQQGQSGKGSGAGKGKGSATSVDGETGAAGNGPPETRLDEPSTLNGANTVTPQVPDADDDDEPFVDDYAFNVDDEKLFAELLDNALFNKGNELLRRGVSW